MVIGYIATPDSLLASLRCVPFTLPNLISNGHRKSEFVSSGKICLTCAHSVPERKLGEKIRCKRYSIWIDPLLPHERECEGFKFELSDEAMRLFHAAMEDMEYLQAKQNVKIKI